MNQINEHRIEKIRIELSWFRRIGHYSFALFPLIIPIMTLYFELSDTQVVNSLPLMVHLICIGLSVLICYLKDKELFIDRLYVARTDDQFREAVFATANKMKWSIQELDNNSATAIAFNLWTSEDSSDISIQKGIDYVQISSVFDMVLTPPDFFGVNKKHKRKFLNNFILTSQVANLNEQVIEDIKAEEQKVEEEPEWNTKNTIKRIIAYVCSALFILGGIAIWRDEGLSWQALVFLILGLGYIIFDIYVMVVKRKRQSRKKAR